MPDRVDTDVERLSRAVGLLVERHAALRTGFQPAGDDLRQVVAATGTLPVRLFAVPPSRADPDGARAATELAADPVDYRDECALRVGLFRIAPPGASDRVGVQPCCGRLPRGRDRAT
ncbi:hypothetical protein [Micromonospora sp. LOL_015]|uniref:hypothetical protein n=1 Tax=Micromonospora sp. LOL_015 TaxID=3345416 RepID=UPI003A868590